MSAPGAPSFAEKRRLLQLETLYDLALTLPAERDEQERVSQVLIYALDRFLRVAHPLMPFLTEELWSYLPNHEQPLILAQWPAADEAYVDEAAEAEEGPDADGVLPDAEDGAGKPARARR